MVKHGQDQIAMGLQDDWDGNDKNQEAQDFFL